MLVGLGAMAIFGFGAVSGLSFELTPAERERKDYHWAWVNGRRWSGMFCKYIGFPLGVVVFVFGVVASLVDVFV